MASKNRTRGYTRTSPKGRGKTASLESRVAALEKRVGLSHEIQDAIDRIQAKGRLFKSAAQRAQTNFRFLANDVTAPAKVVDVLFDLDAKATTAKFARVYQTGASEDIASTAKPHGVLPRQIVGSIITVTMDLTGSPNPTDLGQFTVTNAQHSPISLTVAAGPIGIKTLRVG